MAQEFTYRSARSGALLLGLAIALLVETVALHLWLAASHPVIAWILTSTSLATLLWLAADYRATGSGTVLLTADSLDLRIGHRFAAQLSRAEVASAVRPEWRDVPTPGTPEAAGYLNLMKPATPNVLITLVAPTRVRLAGGIRRSCQRIGLHLDQPDRFISAFNATPARKAVAGRE